MFTFRKHHSLHTPARSRRRIFWGILGFAFFVRLCAIWLAGGSIAERSMSVDASSYHQIAKNVVEIGIFTSAVDPPYNPDIPGTFRPPLTPVYLAVFYRIFGTKLLWGQIGLAFAGALSCGLTYLLGIHVFDEQSGIIAGLISSVYPFFIVLTLVPLTEGLSLFLCLFLLFQLYSSYSSPKTFKQVLGVGCVVGLLLLNKAANITIMPCIVLWGFSPSFTAWKKGLMNVGFVLMFATLIVLPWTIRNYRVTGTLIPVNSNGGWTFYLGNNPYTEHNLDALEQGTSNGWIPPEEVFLPFSDLEFTDTAAWEARSVRLAWRFIIEHPGTFCRLAARKLAIFWSPYHHIVDRATWVPVFLLSVMGLCSTFTAWKQHLLLYVLLISSMLIPIVFTSMPRFRAPLMPFLLLYSAVGLQQLYFLGKRRGHANRN